MKIVQSFWSPPMFATASRENDSRTFGGWNHRKYYYMSWALSCLRLLHYYDEVEVVTDSHGKSILIDCLKLPYTNVSTALDHLRHLDPYVWTIGKLYAYSLQRSTFLHVDGDIFIWDKFEDRIERAALTAQNVEVNQEYYEPVVARMATDFFLPHAMRKGIARKSIEVSNTGVVGGNDIDFFRLYTTQALEMIDKNMHLMSSVSRGVYGVTVEQLLFHALSQQENIPIEYVFPGEVDYETFPVFFRFHHVPKRSKLIHPLATVKRSLSAQNAVENHLREIYPDHYFRILKLCDLHRI